MFSVGLTEIKQKGSYEHILKLTIASQTQSQVRKEPIKRLGDYKLH
jgi:hypothetical protein